MRFGLAENGEFLLRESLLSDLRVVLQLLKLLASSTSIICAETCVLGEKKAAGLLLWGYQCRLWKCAELQFTDQTCFTRRQLVSFGGSSLHLLPSHRIVKEYQACRAFCLYVFEQAFLIQILRSCTQAIDQKLKLDKI